MKITNNTLHFYGKVTTITGHDAKRVYEFLSGFDFPRQLCPYQALVFLNSPVT